MNANINPDNWACFLGDEWDHDWKRISDWYGDPDVIGGTADCSYLECRHCGLQKGIYE